MPAGVSIGDEIGYAVALSKDGTTVALGGIGQFQSDMGSGTALYFFSQNPANATQWLQDGPTISLYVRELAISDDDNTVLAVVQGEYVPATFHRENGSWTRDLFPPFAPGSFEISLSADGQTALVANITLLIPDPCMVALFSRISEGEWVFESTILVQPTSGACPSIALSGDSNTIVIQSVGGVVPHALTYSLSPGGTWVPNTDLVSSGAVAVDPSTYLNIRCALSYDGTTAVLKNE